MDDDKERGTPAEPEEGLVLVEGGVAYDEELLREARLRLEALVLTKSGFLVFNQFRLGPFL